MRLYYINFDAHGTSRVFSVLLGLVVAVSLLVISSSVVQAETQLAENTGFEEAGSDGSIALSWSPFGSGYKRVSRSHSGDWSIRLNSGDFSSVHGAYQRIDLDQTEAKPVFVGGYVKGRNIEMGAGGYFGAALYAEIHLQDGSVVYKNSVPNAGSFRWRWVGFNTATAMAVSQNTSIVVDKPIDYMFIVPILSGATGKAWFDDITVTEFDLTQSAVTIMFDDGEDNVYTHGKPVLDEHGFVGSMAIVTGHIGDDGFMSIDELLELSDDGWEIVSHGLTHSDLTAMSARNARRELSRSKSRLESHGFDVNNFALPLGAYNSSVLSSAAKYYLSVRAYEIGSNPQGTFPFDVKVRSVEETTTPEEVAEWANEAATHNTWNVIVFHTIGEGDDSFHTTPDEFAEMIAVIADSGVNVVTYDEGVSLFGVSE